MATSKSNVLTLDRILAEESVGSPGKGCKVGRWIAGRDGDKGRLMELMADRSQSPSVLTRVLNRMGLEVGRDAVRNHILAASSSSINGCSCKKAGLL